MNLFERRNAIMKTLRKEGHTTVANLAKKFDVSERTIYSDITALSLDQPIQTVRGRYGGGVKLANWFHPNANKLSPKQEELLQRLKPTLAGDDLIVMNSILAQFSPSGGCQYAKDPGRDFTRRRSLTLPTLMSLILTMDEKSMWKGLLGYFQNGIDTPSASAFVQQRKKLLPQAFEDLFHRFTDTLSARKKFQGYRLLAVDGTSLKSMSYPEDSAAYRPGTQRQHGWNLYHINALFDLENGIYTDVLVQKEHTKSEDAALCEMAGRSAGSEPVILLADRGYEAYNNFAHLEQAGWKYLIRLKDRNRTYAYGITLPSQPEFDLPVHITRGRLTRRQLEQRGIPTPEAYCRLPNNVPFDYLEPGNAGFYPFSARILRLRLKDGSMETFITNLDQTQFPPAVLRRLYARRWGIETSFRQLKYTVGMVHLHSKRPELLLQEIFSAFIIFNFTKAAAWEADTAWGCSKYKRRVNFSDAVYLCCQTLRGWFLDVLPLLERKLLPCRPDRSFPRPIIAENRISPMYVPSR